MAERDKATGEEEITVRDANQGFSRLITRVERGIRFVVTKKDRPVARIGPADEDDGAGERRRQAAIRRLSALMQSGARSDDGWTFKGDREALHERDV